MISYAQNFEDVILARVFKGQEKGFYIDIGAGNAEIDSITKHFYDSGWQGINVEPTDEHFQSLSSKRQRDINLNTALSETVTLADICHQHARQTIDFLKIDAAGAESDVLRGGDWSECRPRVLVIKAVKPSSPEPHWDLWEPYLLQQGYLFVYFDGLNRFYIRSEEPALARHFMLPPNILDGFQPSAYLALQEQNNALLDQNDALQEHNHAMQAEAESLHEDLAAWSARTRNAEDQLQAVLASRSFRVGYTIRRVARPAIPVLRPVARLTRGGRRTLMKFRNRYHRAQRLVLRGTLIQLYRQALAPGQIYAFLFTDGGTGRPPATAIEAKDRYEVSKAQLSTGTREAVIQAEIIELLQSHERVPGLSNRDRSSCQAGERPIIVVDVRCLQDPSYPLRNIAQHAAHVLRTVVDACGKENDVALLTDTTLPNLDPDLAAFGHYCISSSKKIDTACVKQLVELSPMTASPGPVLSLLLTPGIHKIAVIYNFLPSDFPGHYLSTDEERTSYQARLATLARYDSFLAVSETTASRLATIIGKDAPVSVTGIADPLPQIEVERPGPADELVPFSTFVLVAGGADARKNLLAAIAAHASYSGTRRRHLGLVVIGDMPAEMESAAVGFAADCGLGTHRLKFCSGLNDRQLRSLYSRATVVIVPSFAEGFSLPVIEAIDAGTPVVASNIAAHRELLGAGWWLADPDDPLALGRSVDRALKDAQNLLERERAAIGNRFATGDVTSRLKNALTQIPAPQKAVDVAPLPRPAKNGRPRLAVITPFPPQQSGIASYSAFTMQAMAKYADVDIYTDSRRGPSSYDGMELHPYAIDPYIRRDFDAVISVLGNSPVHIPILEYFLEFGGACIAHDPRMIEIYHRLRGPEGLAALFSRHSREPIPADYLYHIEYAEDRDLLPSTVYDEIAPQAQPLMVHSENLSRRIFAETGVESVVLPYVPHLLPRSNKIDPEIVSSARYSLGWRDESIHIATFGTLDQRAKGIEISMDAVAWLHQWGVPCDLHFVGPALLKDRNELLLRAQRLGLSRSVHFTGWIPTDRWEAYLLAVDAAVQVRTFTPFPVTSRSLLDCAAFGVPSVATENLALELQTPAYVGSIPDRFSALLVAESLADLLESRRPEASVKNELQRRDWLETRTADVYARHLLAVLGLGEYPA